ncbi:MAG: DNA primase [Deltaproteobacteria bacterium]|jgi:putative DNA primase/helicase|nr:DNA primase [Deltaproteobacteria bacterium]
MSDKSTTADALKKQVEARVLEEERTAPQSAEKKETTLGIDFLKTCLYGNRVGDANLFAAMFRGQFVFVERWGRWLRWAGHHWSEDINSRRSLAAIERVCEQYQRILANEEEGSDLYKLVRKRLNVLRDMSGRENLLDCAATIDEPLCIEGEELDKQEYLLACPNGVIDLRTGEAAPGKPEQYVLNACPTEWKGLTPNQKFMDFLNSCFDGDTEMVQYILRLLGYGLLGRRDDHIWVIFHGPRGRNGKDTLMKVIFKVLGHDLAIKIPTAMLLQQTFQRSGSQPEPDVMALRGAKMAFASEGESGQKIAMAKLKDLTGGSIITARGINDKLMTSWAQTHLLFFFTNELPRMKSDDDAFWTRLHAVHWPIRFVDDPKDPDERKRDPRIATALEEDPSGVLACMVQGCMDYLDGGLRPPEKVLAYTKEQRENFDDIGQFLTDACIREAQPPDGSDWKTTTAVATFVSVCNWWLRQTFGSTYNYSAKRVTQTLEKKGIISKKSSVKFYHGVEIKPDVQAEYDTAKAEEDKKASRGRS